MVCPPPARKEGPSRHVRRDLLGVVLTEAPVVIKDRVFRTRFVAALADLATFWSGRYCTSRSSRTSTATVTRALPSSMLTPTTEFPEGAST